MNVKGLVIPNKLDVDKKTLSNTYGTFIAEPFEPGYGHTIGNSLRRLLLSSLEGAAITAIKIKGVAHEYAVIPGVVEDVMGIILNLKNVRFKMATNEQQVVHLKAKGPRDVTAGDIEGNAMVEVMNKDLVIARLDVNGEIDMELMVDKGRGYLPVEKQDRSKLPARAIAVDAIFTPITRVNYEVENARVGHITDYDRLIMEIWTDGTISPEDALGYAAKILKDSMAIFITTDEEATVLFTKAGESEQNTEQEELLRMRELLDQNVDMIELSVRSSNCLRNAKIKYIKDLVIKTEAQLIDYKNFGKKSLDEIKAKLAELGMSLGMDTKKYYQ